MSYKYIHTHTHHQHHRCHHHHYQIGHKESVSVRRGKNGREFNKGELKEEYMCNYWNLFAFTRINETEILQVLYKTCGIE